MRQVVVAKRVFRGFDIGNNILMTNIINTYNKQTTTINKLSMIQSFLAEIIIIIARG